MNLSGHQRSTTDQSDTWITPPEILKALGEFDLDPCTPEVMPWETAKKRYTKKDDGLVQPWDGRVWMNPPFGKEAAKWLKKLSEHGNGIALLPARTETKMFFDHVWGKADAVCFIKSRPHFYYADGMRAPFNSGAPICLIAYGPINKVALFNSNLGYVVNCNDDL